MKTKEIYNNGPLVITHCIGYPWEFRLNFDCADVHKQVFLTKEQFQAMADAENVEE